MPEKVVNYQAPYTDQSLIAYIAGSALELCLCWKLTPRATSPLAGSPIGATSNTRDLVLPGHGSLVFRSSLGGIPTTVDTEQGHESAGLQVQSIFEDDAITPEAIEAGDWHGAKFEIFTVAYRNLAMGQLIEFAGRIGQVDTEGVRFKAEARALTAIAKQRIGHLVTAKCPERLGGPGCKVDLNSPAAGDGGAITVTGTVTASADPGEFVDTSRTEGENYFGRVKFTSGLLAGREYEVKAYDAATKKFTLQLAAPRAIDVGTTYTAIRRCDKRLATCHAVYGNVPNYRGFPHITNIEQINRIVRAV